MRAFDFPDWYGRNWHAFWDSIIGLVPMPHVLRFVHWRDFEARMPTSAAMMMIGQLDDMRAQFPDSAPRVERA